jgi:hypothetical protein
MGSRGEHSVWMAIAVILSISLIASARADERVGTKSEVARGDGVTELQVAEFDQQKRGYRDIRSGYHRQPLLIVHPQLQELYGLPAVW